MSKKINVAFVRISHGTFAGASKMLLRLMSSLDDSIFTPKLISQRDDKLCIRARNYGINVSIVPYPGSLDQYDSQLLQWKNIPPASARLLQYNYNIKQQLDDVDIIWCQNSRVMVTLAPYIKLSDQAIIWNIGLGLKSSGMMSYIHSVCFRLSNRVFIESETQAKTIFSESVYKSYREKFEIFHKGIDTATTFNPKHTSPLLKRDNFLVGTAASITRRKGIEYLIEAMRDLSDIHQVDLVVAGEVPDNSQAYKSELEEQIDEYGLNDRVEFLGWIDDMPSYLCSLDIFVLTSLNEGVPGAVREALAMAVPVIATDVGGTSDVVIDQQTGYLIPPQNSELLRKRIEMLISDGELRSTLGKKGRKLIKEEFSIEQYKSNYQRLLQDLHSNHN